MKKLLLFLFTLTTLYACKSIVKQDILTYGASYAPVSTTKITKDTINILQLDSLFTADNLPAMKKWASSELTDAETLTTYNYYTLYDKHSHIIYTVKELPNKKFVIVKKKMTNK